jgi:glucose-1-phosphate cytidylyltransferase
MKVILICNGHERSNATAPVYYRKDGTVLLKIMKYYARYGHKDFVLFLGKDGGVIKNYFLNFRTFTPVDFVLTSGSHINFLGTDIDDWNITFDHSPGVIDKSRKLSDLKKYLVNDRDFLVNDGMRIPEGPLDKFISQFNKSDKSGMRLGIGRHRGFEESKPASFIFKKKILGHINPEQELSIGMFSQLVKKPQMFYLDSSHPGSLIYI